MKKSELYKLKELARMYFLHGEAQNVIAEKVGISPQTISKWVRENEWDSLRAAKTITRRELVAKMLQKVDELLSSEKFSPDELVKAAAAVEKLDKKTNVVTVIEIFSAYNHWLVSRMQLDSELTPELVKTMNGYQDLFIGEKLSSVSIGANND